MRNRKRRPKISKDELREIAQGLNTFGDMLVMMGEIEKREKELRRVDRLMRKFFRADDHEFFLALQDDPDLLANAADLASKWAMLSETLDKDPYDMSPDDRIEAGESYKELSHFFSEIAEHIRDDETSTD